MTQTLAIVKVIGVTKSRNRDVVSRKVNGSTRRIFFFLNFLPKSLGNVGRLFQYRLLVANLPFFMVMLSVTCISLSVRYLTQYPCMLTNLDSYCNIYEVGLWHVYEGKG